MHTVTWAMDMAWRAILRDLGVDAVHVLRRAQLPDDLLQRPGTRLDSEAWYRFWDALEAEVGDPCFPIRLCESIRGDAFSPPLFAALSSPNLRVAMERIARYKALVAPMRLSVEVAPSGVSLGFSWLDAPLIPPASLVLTEVLFFVGLARMGTREPVRPVEVLTPVMPSPVAPYEAFLGARLIRAAAARVTFAAVDATRPFLTANEGLWADFEPHLRRRLADLEADASTGDRVRAVLREGLAGGTSSVDDVARRLGLSSRTLQRRLAGEGASFQQVLRETRTALGVHYLAKTTLPIAEVAFLLGFDEPNSFYRAWRAWTGETPDSVRQPREAKR
jgi:AraC-like DNA-binding protein